MTLNSISSTYAFATRANSNNTPNIDYININFNIATLSCLVGVASPPLASLRLALRPYVLIYSIIPSQIFLPKLQSVAGSLLNIIIITYKYVNEYLLIRYSYTLAYCRPLYVLIISNKRTIFNITYTKEGEGPGIVCMV